MSLIRWTQTLRPSDPQTFRPSEPQSLRPSDPRTLRSLDPQILRSSDTQTWVCVASLPRLASEGLIVLWLLYYLQSCRYLASPNSFKCCVDSENKPGGQRPGGIQRSDCTASSPPFGSACTGLEGKMDAHTKTLDFRQGASAPEVSWTCPLECHLSRSGFTFRRRTVEIWFEMSPASGICLKKTALRRWRWSENVTKRTWRAGLRSGGVLVMTALGGKIMLKSCGCLNLT